MCRIKRRDQRSVTVKQYGNPRLFRERKRERERVAEKSERERERESESI